MQLGLPVMEVDRTLAWSFLLRPLNFKQRAPVRNIKRYASFTAYDSLITRPLGQILPTNVSDVLTSLNMDRKGFAATCAEQARVG